jgi:hypothetical protein
MARAYSIFLVVDNERDGVEPIAAFTVKRECLEWLARCRVATPGADSWRVLRFHDGCGDHGYEEVKTE